MNNTIQESLDFIGLYELEDKTIAPGIVEFYENNPNLHHDAVSGAGKNNEIVKSRDISLFISDFVSDEHEVFFKLLNHLKGSFKHYKENMNYISNMFSEMNCNEFIIKKYLKDDHYQKWHCERSNLKTSDRAFAWMIYLNTVNNGGETDFYYYNKSIKPKEGLTLIWPADWTHLHRGNTVIDTKYIITGMFKYAS